MDCSIAVMQNTEEEKAMKVFSKVQRGAKFLGVMVFL